MVRKALTAIGALLVAACGPDLADNGALRCEESLECQPASYCYRGFCVPDPSAPQAPISVDDPASSSEDAGLGLIEGDAAVLPAEDASSSPVEIPAPVDAGMSPPIASESPVTSPAATPTTPAATPATPATPAAPGSADASVPAGSSCTLKECCAEAKRAYEERKKHENEDGWTQKPGKCGCSMPDLLNTLTCGLGSLTGLT